MRGLTYLIALALLAMMILAPNAGARESQTIYIRDFHFSSTSIYVEPGTKVTWVNRGQAPHTVTQTGGAFDSRTLQPGQSYSHTFNLPGSYAYHCQIHPSMRGTVVVVNTLEDTGGPPMVPAVTLAASLALVISSLGVMRFMLR